MRNTRLLGTSVMVLALFTLFMLFTAPCISAEGGFNLKVDIPPEYQNILAGEDVFATFMLFKIDNEIRKDITIEYWVMGPAGEIGRRQETIAIETQASLVRSVELPLDAPEGDYALQAQVLYGEGQEQLASGSFSVYKETSWQEAGKNFIGANKGLLITGGVLILLIGGILLSWNNLKKMTKHWRLKRKIASIVKRRQKN